MPALVDVPLQARLSVARRELSGLMAFFFVEEALMSAQRNASAVPIVAQTTRIGGKVIDNFNTSKKIRKFFCIKGRKKYSKTTTVTFF